MRTALSVVSLFALTLVVACGGGGYPVYGPSPLTTIAPASATTSSVSFIVVVPPATGPASAKRRPAFTAPSSTQAVQISLFSVNGVAYTGSPAISGLPLVANVSSANSACQTLSGQLTCSLTINGLPVGALVFQVDTYASTWTSPATPPAPTGEGFVTVNTTAGQVATATAQLNGTVSSVVLSIDGAAELGATANLPVIVSALDSNGATIIGAYSTPITLSDTDASGQTSLSSTAQISSSSAATGITLNYLGGAMTTAALIGATASGIPANEITSASFLPDSTVPTVNGASTSFAYNYSDQYSSNSSPNTGSGSYTVNVSTGQSFNGQSNLIEMSGVEEPNAASEFCCGNLNAYYAYTPQGGSTSLGYVGYANNGDGGETCAAPFNQQLVIPFPPSWNVLSGSGACTYTYSDGTEYNETTIFQSDGSYSDIGYYDYSPSDAGTYDWVSQSDGSANIISSCVDGPSYIVALPAPNASPSTAIAIQEFPTGPVPSPGSTVTPAPVSTTVPNIWLAIANASTPAPTSGGVPNLPLETDQVAVQAAPAALPSACPVSASILGTQPSLSQANETVTIADPMDDWHDFYTLLNVQHYYLNGVGEVCTILNAGYWYPSDGAINYYNGTDQAIESETETEATYVTTTSLTATYAHVRNFAQSLPATTRAFTAATYALIHAHLDSNHRKHAFGAGGSSAAQSSRPATR